MRKLKELIAKEKRYISLRMNEITQCRKLKYLNDTCNYNTKIVEVNIRFDYENNIVLENLIKI